MLAVKRTNWLRYTKKVNAAKCIQKHVRRFLARLKLHQTWKRHQMMVHRKQSLAAIKIQTAMRAWYSRRKFTKIKERYEQMIEIMTNRIISAVIIQKTWRMSKARKAYLSLQV